MSDDSLREMLLRGYRGTAGAALCGAAPGNDTPALDGVDNLLANVSEDLVSASDRQKLKVDTVARAAFERRLARGRELNAERKREHEGAQEQERAAAQVAELNRLGALGAAVAKSERGT